MTKNRKKLALRTDTIRVLDKQELAAVDGGAKTTRTELTCLSGCYCPTLAC